MNCFRDMTVLMKNLDFYLKIHIHLRVHIERIHTIRVKLVLKL